MTDRVRGPYPTQDIGARDYQAGFWFLKDRLSAVHYSATHGGSVFTAQQNLDFIAEHIGDVLEAVEQWLEPTRMGEHSFGCWGPCACGTEGR